MKFLSLSRRRFSARKGPSGEERGETDVFASVLKRLQIYLSFCVSKLACITSIKAMIWNLIVMLTGNVYLFA